MKPRILYTSTFLIAVHFLVGCRDGEGEIGPDLNGVGDADGDSDVDSDADADADAGTIRYGESHTGQYHLGPVDFAESDWHNACAPEGGYRQALRDITGLGNGTAGRARQRVCRRGGHVRCLHSN